MSADIEQNSDLNQSVFVGFEPREGNNDDAESFKSLLNSLLNADNLSETSVVTEPEQPAAHYSIDSDELRDTYRFPLFASFSFSDRQNQELSTAFGLIKTNADAYQFHDEPSENTDSAQVVKQTENDPLENSLIEPGILLVKAGIMPGPSEDVEDEQLIVEQPAAAVEIKKPGPVYGPPFPTHLNLLIPVKPDDLTGGRRSASKRIRELTGQEREEFNKQDQLKRRASTPTTSSERVQAFAAGSLLAATVFLGVAKDQGYTKPAEIIESVTAELFD